VWEKVLEAIANFLWLVECKLWLPKKTFMPSIDYQRIITQMPYIQEHQSILV
jgi:hypothetical protein